MKNIILSIFFFLSFISLSAQDIITTQKGDKLSVKIVSIGQNEVSYTHGDLPITTSKADIVSIQFENGDIMNFGKKNKNRWYKAEKQRYNKHSKISSTNIMWGSIASMGVLAIIASFIIAL